MTIVITGWKSRIAEEFRALVPQNEGRIWGRPLDPGFPTDADRYLFCQGLLRPKRYEEQTEQEIKEGIEVNYASIVRACDLIIARNDRARICIIGSESGYRGSYDENYASAKALIHRYVESKQLRTPLQQLIGISPSIVGNAGMTLRRTDHDNLYRRRVSHPKGRFLRAEEVARVAYFCLYEASVYLTNTVIRLNGGEK